MISFTFSSCANYIFTDTYINRALLPSMLASYHAQSQCELLFVSAKNFYLLLAEQAMNDLRRRFEVIKACGIFSNWSRLELLRMARMGFVRSYKTGDVIIEQVKLHLFILILSAAHNDF